MSKSEKLYKNSPKLERDNESGSVGVKKPTESDAEDMGVAGSPLPGSSGEMPVDVHNSAERDEVKHKHINEHLTMHRRHQMEHAMHKGEDRKPLHKKHEMELKEMHDRHHTEIVAMHKRHDKASTGLPKQEMKEAEPHSKKEE